MTAADLRHMDHALRLARRGLGNVWPNPAVGCVIVRGAQIVGRGWTQPGGRPHAEAMALSHAGPAAHGATAYVTLEPCSHHGRTPPCAEALITAGVRRVVVATGDPDQRVNGRGIAKLREAGIDVATGVREHEARALQIGFLSRIERDRPMVTLKLATSLDGRIAMASGESRWITGPAARAQVQALRASHDAVMVGGGTARADLPSLNLRWGKAVRQPVRVVISRQPLPDLPVEGAQFGPLWQISEPCNAAGAIDLEGALRVLADRGLTRILCEGGGRLAASLLRAGLVDRLVTFGAGVALGAEGRPALGLMDLSCLADAPRFHLTHLRRVGADLMAEWAPLGGWTGAPERGTEAT